MRAVNFESLGVKPYRKHVRNLASPSSSDDPEARRWWWDRWPPSQWAQGQKKGQSGWQWAKGSGAPTEPQALSTERQKHFISSRQSMQSVKPQLHARPRTARGWSQWEVGAWAKGRAFLFPYYFPLCLLHITNLPDFQHLFSFCFLTSFQWIKKKKKTPKKQKPKNLRTLKVLKKPHRFVGTL